MDQHPEDQEPPAPPATYYLTLAGIPAGLLLWLGGTYVLRHTGATPEEAAGSILMIKLMSYAGLIIAILCIGAAIRGTFRKP